jgi:acetolactate synthase-1/2/3 large subunit
MSGGVYIQEGVIRMKMTGALAIMKAMESEGVEVIFGYPGAAICPFYDALLETPIKHILTRNEQGAAHAASGYSRVTGKTGVCVATSGPGATNLITGIATAYMDSIPMVAITGQVSSELIGRDVFQEADITGATEPFCKHNYLVKNVKELPRIIKEAFHIASTGRPGPVVIDIPIDIQMKEFDFTYPEKVDIKGYKPNIKGHPHQIKRAADAIAKAKAPLICAGGGIINANATDELRLLAEKNKIPVVTTLMGKGAMPWGHDQYLGMLGSHGLYSANYAVHNADLIIIMGARVGDRAMGTASKIAQKAKIIHIDIDPAEIGKNVEVTIPVVGDIKLVLSELITEIQKGDIEEWLEKLADASKKNSILDMNEEPSDKINPKLFLQIMSDIIGKDAVITTEVGQNQIWAANNCKTADARTFITSGGMGTMGYGLPSSIGAKVGARDKIVIAVCGDGSFQMSMNELGTMKQEKLEIKIIIFNNTRLGMVRELQKVRFCSRYSEVFLEDNPDFIKLADAYGFKADRINSNSEIRSAISKMMDTEGTYILECLVDPEESTL